MKLTPAPRRIFKSIFPKETRALENLISQHLVGEVKGGKQWTAEIEDLPGSSQVIVYSLEAQPFVQLGYALQKIQAAARPAFRLAGRRLPELPYWGDFGDVGAEFYSPSDFEILVISYRAQVEHFLT